MRLLTDYRWPGNVRELRTVVENLVVFATGDTIDRDDLQVHVVSLRASAAHGPA